MQKSIANELQLLQKTVVKMINRLVFFPLKHIYAFCIKIQVPGFPQHHILFLKESTDPYMAAMPEI